MKAERSVAMATRGSSVDENRNKPSVESLREPTGKSVSKQALEQCLAHHKERLLHCLGKHLHGQWGAEGHERCIKWITLAQAEEEAGLMVTRELHVGYLLNERMTPQFMLGIEAETSAEYHRSIWDERTRMVLGIEQEEGVLVA